MFSTLSGGRRYPGSIAHRHKNVTFGKIAIGVAKGTAMIVIGVPVCTIAAGLGATAIVAYGLASPFYYGGKKLVRTIRRHRIQRKDQEGLLLLQEAPDGGGGGGAGSADRLTREDILIWLENCGEEDDEQEDFNDGDENANCDDIPLSATMSPTSPSAAAAAVSGASSAAAAATATAGRRKPTLRRLFSRESRGFLYCRSADAGADAVDKGDDDCHGEATHQQQQQQQQQQRRQRQRLMQRQRLQEYGELVASEEGSCEEPDQAELWKEMESAVSRLREDRRLSICAEDVVAMERPLLLTDGKDVLKFIRHLQLESHLGQLARAGSLPNLVTARSPSLAEDLDQLGSLPGQEKQHQQQHQQKPHQRKYKRTISEGCGLLQQQPSLASAMGQH